MFAAGAGPGSGRARKDTVDRAAAVLLADAAERAGVRRYLLVSAMGVDAVADGATPENMDEVFLAYLRAKLAAEQDLLGRTGLATTVLRPGSLTDDPGTGRVTLGPARRPRQRAEGRRGRGTGRPAGRTAPTARSWNWWAATSPSRRLSARWTDGALW